MTTSDDMTDKNERVRTLLARLRQELEATRVDPQTAAEMRDLENDMHALLNANGPPAGLLARAKAADVQFAARHQVAEGILREIVDTLARIGV